MAFDIGAVTATVKADISQFQQGMEEAKAEASSFSENVGNVTSNIRDFANQAGIFVGVQVASLGLLAKQAVDVASNFEQTQTSFGTILGSEEKAAKLMQQIMDFEQHTPFDIQTLTDGAKQLLAFGVSAEQVVPKMKELTDISQGQSFKLQELVSIYGQVNAIQRLNGREVLRLSSIGVPIYQQLADYYNKMGGAAKSSSVEVNAFGETVTKVSKNNATTLADANTKLSEQNAQLKYLQDQHPKTAQAIQKHDLAVQKLKDSIDKTNRTIGQHTLSLQAVSGQSQVTAKDIQEMISKGEVSAADFDAVLSQMTSKGGMFYQENIRQMSTFNGILSSTRSQIQYAILNLMGIDIGAANEVRKGGLFDTLRSLAADLLDALHKLQPVLSQIGQNRTFQLAVQGMVIALASLAVIIPVVIVALNPIILAVLGIEAAIVGLYVAWNTNFLGIRDITQTLVQQITHFYNDFLKPLIDAFAKQWSAHWNENLKVLQDVWKVIEGVITIAWALVYGILEVGLALLQGKWSKVWEALVDTAKIAWEGLKLLFNGALDFVAKWAGDVYQRLVQPFEDAWHAIQNIMTKIRDALDFTKRHSPSVIDIIQNGVKLANQAFGELAFVGNVNMTPSAAFSTAMGGNVSNEIHIHMDGALVTDESSAMAMGEKIGDALIQKLKLNVRF